MFNGEIFHLKRILKRLFYYKWKSSCKLLVNFLHVSIVLLSGTKYRTRKLRSSTLKRNNLKVYIFLKENKLARFAKSSGTGFGSRFLEKNITKSTLLDPRYTPHGTQKSQQGIQKNCVPEFANLSALKFTFIWTSGL